MNKILKITGIVVGIILLLWLLFMSYMGMFGKVTVVEKELGPYTYVYKSFQGPYKDTGKVFEDVYAKLQSVSVNSTLGIGVYYDDPQTTPADKLRSDCGSIIMPEDVDTVKTLGEEYVVGVLPQAKRLVVEFPVKNSMSYMVGPMKAYPAMMKYAKEKGYNEMVVGYEIYDMDKVLYVMDIIENEEE